VDIADGKLIDECKYIDYAHPEYITGRWRIRRDAELQTLFLQFKMNETSPVNRQTGEDERCCDYKTLVAVFKALSDESRQKILLSLQETGETRVSELVKRFGVSQPTMSHHLGVLRQAGLVEDRRVGQSVYYDVNRQWLQRCCNDYLSRFRIEDEF